MIGIKCPASQNVEHEERYTFRTTLEGRRKAQPRPIGRRTWSLQTSDATTPAQVATLMQFAQGAWGPGPFIFVSVDAQCTNILTPEAADCRAGEYILAPGAEVLGTTTMATPDRILPASYLKTKTERLYFGAARYPVIPGIPVTAAAYVRGAGAYVSVYWYDENNAFISSVDSQVRPVGSEAVRSWVTATPPANAVSMRFSMSREATQGGGPSLTWTDKLMPYADGQGCFKTVVHSVSRGLVLAVPGATYSNLSFTVTEVG